MSFCRPLLLLLGTLVLMAANAQVEFRPPAVPLVTCDPYFSIWSNADRLTDVPTSHWTGKPHRLTSLVRIDGVAYRIMGDQPESVPALPQTALSVLPLETEYRFQGAGVEVRLNFLTPALPDDLDMLSRPVTYLTWSVDSIDKARHKVQIYFDASYEIAVDDPSQRVDARYVGVGSSVLKMGTVDQPILRKAGDDRRIDWGYFYVAPGYGGNTVTALVEGDHVPFGPFLPSRVDGLKSARPPALRQPKAVVMYDLMAVPGVSASRFVVLAYDDQYSIEYFGKRLRPYWRRNGKTMPKLLSESIAFYAATRKRCARFEAELMHDLRRSGGEKYALMAALAYRQCFAGNKIAADANGQPLVFPKENTSNGCIGTVDVIFPMSPQFLLFGPSLTKAMIVSNLDYGSSPRWKWPFAPHDLGTYPKANGQVYGGGERTEDDQMPVEETGNMLILVAALAKMEGSPEFASKYWPTLEKWAAFLKTKGFDPENQLSTDDFMGHLAHNTNLSVKAILGLASFAYLCDARGLSDEARKYRELAKSFAMRWVTEAQDGDHFRLAFDKPGSWSQKYNLVWDKILGLDVFPDSVRQEEVAFYIAHRNPYGVALDSRQGGTPAKLDWSLWSATLTGDRHDFDAISDPVFRFLNETPQRVPMSDLYNTRTGHQIAFDARPVVGGVFLKLLYDPAVWRKWAARDKTKAANWAPLPKPMVYRSMVPTSEHTPVVWRYTTDKPGADWLSTSFDERAWKRGPGAFGTRGTPGIAPRTTWSTDDIWIRRDFTLATLPKKGLYLRMFHDEDIEVYVNGVLVSHEAGYITSYENLPLDPSALAAFHVGKNLLAVHCHQTTGGQGVDVGFAVSPPAP